MDVADGVNVAVGIGVDPGLAAPGDKNGLEIACASTVLSTVAGLSCIWIGDGEAGIADGLDSMAGDAGCAGIALVSGAGVPTPSGVPGEAGDLDVVAVASGIGVPSEPAGLPVGTEESIGGDDAAPGDGLPEAVDELAGGATMRGVSVAPGVALTSNMGKSDIPEGEASTTGDAELVAWRSAALWVSTAGAIVTTISLGCELDRVSTTARKRLASKVPATMSAFVRFNETSRSRCCPGAGSGVSNRLARAASRDRFSCRCRFYP